MTELSNVLGVFCKKLAFAPSSILAKYSRIETRAGRRADQPTTKLIEEARDRLALLVRVLEVQERA